MRDEYHKKIGCCGFPVSKAKYFEALDVVDPFHAISTYGKIRYYRLHGISTEPYRDLQKIFTKNRKRHSKTNRKNH